MSSKMSLEARAAEALRSAERESDSFLQERSHPSVSRVRGALVSFAKMEDGSFFGMAVLAVLLIPVTVVLHRTEQVDLLGWIVSAAYVAGWVLALVQGMRGKMNVLAWVFLRLADATACSKVASALLTEAQAAARSACLGADRVTRRIVAEQVKAVRLLAASEGEAYVVLEALHAPDKATLGDSFVESVVKGARFQQSWMPEPLPQRVREDAHKTKVWRSAVVVVSQERLEIARVVAALQEMAEAQAALNAARSVDRQFEEVFSTNLEPSRVLRSLLEETERETEALASAHREVKNS